MLRFRRYRLFVICSVVILFLLYRVSQNSAWDAPALYGPQPQSQPKPNPDYQRVEKPEKVDKPEKPAPEPEAVEEDAAPPAPPIPKPVKEQTVKIPDLKTSLEVKGSFGLPTPTKKPAAGAVETSEAELTTPVIIDIPDRVPGKVDDIYGSKDDEELHIQKPPGAYQGQSIAAETTIHWKKVPEHFPVAEESIIPLPTGKPKPIPSVQYKFAEESSVAKEKRETRLAQVKAAMKRAWSGYWTYAKGHDELMPITKIARDPFCGWAATLVDSLDTLWIMEMKEEFEAAYVALSDIDFTTTPFRQDIPVFETIIRYLGGLIAAYDVTGGKEGKHPNLLKKAEELAEILMGVFDTPNRMPILYYNWKPAYASQPQRASTSVSVAELGSMSMEFTRLAQLTGENKYYDAIARITDAFYEWQNRPDGTTLPGLFPQQIDASGCNRTAPAFDPLAISSDAVRENAAEALTTEPQGYTPAGQIADADLEFQVKEGEDGGPAKGEFKKIGKRADESDLGAPVETKSTSTAASSVETVPEAPRPGSFRGDGLTPKGANGLPAGWDCVPQNLTSGGYGYDQYSMGGSQDSAYEYFPKQHLLLGGLEPKYRSMHEKTVDAVKKHLLYQPMTKDDRDILFSGKVYGRGNSDADLSMDFEVTHLTCFLGGMFGLGGKIFDRPEDVEIGKKLADGCVWAYEMMPTGIMPETSMVAPCPRVGKCHWNETRYYELLDPSYQWRLQQMEQWEDNMEDWKIEKERALVLEEERQRALEEQSRRPHNLTAAERLEKDTEEPSLRDIEIMASDLTEAAKANKAKSSAPVGKRDVDDGATNPASDSVFEKERKKVELPEPDIKGDWNAIDEKVKKLEEELDMNAGPDRGSYGGQNGQVPISEEPIYIPPEPIKPLSHEEYVKGRIERDNIPPGFVSLNDPRYILRPEAIESVWYMYRITGDPEWQEKGWRMFTSIIKWTETDVGHSAIANVAKIPEERDNNMVDNMESFWLAETLKYFYLLYTTPDVISLDDWVLNTEAHPFKRPT
ncbi:putative glycoside hydrolase family 47 protein [Phaeoacremonium minimum UCRPA7]|uniref:alpha-1,2-Mannosidase n=1 Tax=Phaeoacremonium minimum (strain UCR-PA7) TaxID=1286976 RepID=R8BFD1_PHAM7|nr:putative glycoside hydrolase family 47 protein [Phaeoacremonium minimum UCRPA7]EON98016.1 putative glycoside hydrolase family 47 protein [Phaeoacremonium minimum UCRPA7]